MVTVGYSGSRHVLCMLQTRQLDYLVREFIQSKKLALFNKPFNFNLIFIIHCHLALRTPITLFQSNRPHIL